MHLLMLHKRACLMLALFFLIAGQGFSAVRAQEGGLPDTEGQPIRLYEQKIKAGLVYNFLKYTVWPEASLPSDKKHLRVCLFGGDPFDGYLYPLEGRTAQQHIITIRSLNELQGVENCHMLFIHRRVKDTLPELLAKLKGKAVLTISDIHQFSKRGGMVEFSMQEDQRIHLYINKAAVENAGLTVQDRLLKLTKLVQ